jgi:hypothetical protein
MTRQTKIAVARSDMFLITGDALCGWFRGGELDVERVHARIDKILHRLVEECGCVVNHGAANRAIDRLRTIRDELELAARPPGEVVQLTRQQVESVLNDIGEVACAIRELAEGVL